MDDTILSPHSSSYQRCELTSFCFVSLLDGEAHIWLGDLRFTLCGLGLLFLLCFWFANLHDHRCLCRCYFNLLLLMQGPSLRALSATLEGKKRRCELTSWSPCLFLFCDRPYQRKKKPAFFYFVFVVVCLFGVCFLVYLFCLCFLCWHRDSLLDYVLVLLQFNFWSPPL